MRKIISRIYKEIERQNFLFRKLILITADQSYIFILIIQFLIHGIFIKNIYLLIINFHLFFISLIIFILTGQ